jgi:DNA-binding winged helix-turn-helix (wHTH) protein
MEACLQEKWPDTTTDEQPASQNEVAGWGFVREADANTVQDPGPTEFHFGSWCLVPRARLLLREGRPVELGSRAFDLLHLLLSRRGLVVEKSAIVSFVWPNTIVEESNLRFQMATLRKALGDARALIKTIPGRGYILAADYEVAA